MPEIEAPRPRRQRPAQKVTIDPYVRSTLVHAFLMICALYIVVLVTLSQVANSGRGEQTNTIVKQVNLEEQQIQRSETAAAAEAKRAPGEILAIENYMVRCVIDQFAHAAGDPYVYTPVPKGCPVSTVLAPK